MANWYVSTVINLLLKAQYLMLRSLIRFETT